MSREFEEVSALVTGGARGIGRAIVTSLARAGAMVTFVDLLADAAAETVEAAGGPERCRFVAADVSQAEGAEMAVQEAVEFGGGLDVLVNNAGITRDGLLMRMSDEDWARVIAVNLTGTFLMTRAAVRRLMRSKRGRVINMASVVGLMGNAGQANYAASKGGVIAFTKAVARELAGRSITVNAVAPGFVQTEMTAALPEKAARELRGRIPLGRLGTVDDIADVVAFLASEDAGYITGQVIPVDGGMVM
ncbi:MAG: 3-oxoacyl-[acyl-carrier-protein] reductase [Planctomycetota bacterium]